MKTENIIKAATDLIEANPTFVLAELFEFLTAELLETMKRENEANAPTGKEIALKLYTITSFMSAYANLEKWVNNSETVK